MSSTRASSATRWAGPPRRRWWRRTPAFWSASTSAAPSRRCSRAAGTSVRPFCGYRLMASSRRAICKGATGFLAGVPGSEVLVVGGTCHTSFTDCPLTGPHWAGTHGRRRVAGPGRGDGDVIAAFVGPLLAGPGDPWPRSWHGTPPSDARRATRRDVSAAAERRTSSGVPPICLASSRRHRPTNRLDHGKSGVYGVLHPHVAAHGRCHRG